MARACNEPGCPEVQDAPRCQRHQPQRPTTAQRGYGAAWAATARRFLAANPWCARCGARATQADHVVPLSQGGSGDDANLRPLCHPCHSRRTAVDQSGWAS